MLIFLSIVAGLAVVITALLQLRVYVIIKNDEKNNLLLRAKFLHLTFGEKADPNNPTVKAIKRTAGIDRFEKEYLEANLKESGLSATVSESCQILAALLKEVAGLLKYCTVKKTMVHIVCASGDAAEIAMRCGKCSAVVYPLLGLLSSLMNVKRKGCDVDIRGDFEGGEEVFRYDFLISVSLGHVLAAFFRVAYAEARRQAQENEENQPL